MQHMATELFQSPMLVCVWNGLPQRVTFTPSVAVFQSWLKTRLFDILYPTPL